MAEHFRDAAKMVAGAPVCIACEAAVRNILSGAYRRDCRECQARLLAHSPACWAASLAGAITPRYRDALIANFGAEWLEGHALVKRWAERIEEARAQPADGSSTN